MSEIEMPVGARVISETGRAGVYEGQHPLHAGVLIRFDGDGGQSLVNVFEVKLAYWQPIATAKRDGTRLLLAEFHPGAKGGFAGIEHGAWEFIETSEFDGVRCYGWCTDMGRIEEPTHWSAALPEPK